MPVLDRVEEIALGDSFVCFRRDDATTACFTSYSDREMLAGQASGVGRPAILAGPRAQAIGASSAGACVLDPAGAVWCWGERLVRSPVEVPGVTGDVRRGGLPRELCGSR
jgi:hypothetical protein